MKKIMLLGFLRFFSAIVMLGSNYIIVRYLTLDEIGRYYLYATLSYLGNATVFVGADYILQRKLAQLSITRQFCPSGLWIYFLKTIPIGGVIVFSFTTIYFCLNSKFSILAVISCTALTIATYFSNAIKNVLQLSGLPQFASFSILIEQSIRLVLCFIIVKFISNDATWLLIVNTLAAIIAGLTAFTALSYYNKKSQERYFHTYKEIISNVIPIGFGGVLNWAQLQGYRPLINYTTQRQDMIGIVSFLTVLGSTATVSIMSIIGQIWSPKLYVSQGKMTNKYLKVVFITSVCLIIASIPSAWFFLKIVNKQQLLPYIFLVPIGVIIEACNTALGIYTSDASVKHNKLWFLTLYASIGMTMSFLPLLFLKNSEIIPYYVGVTLMISQLLVVLCVAIHRRYAYNTGGAVNA